MMERLIIVSLVITMSAFSEASSCETVFQVFSACSLSAGGVLNTFTNIRSKIECTFLCIQDDMCLSSMFSESGECHLYSEYKSFTPCTSQDFYLSLYETSCRVTTNIPTTAPSLTTTSAFLTTTTAIYTVMPSAIFTSCLDKPECTIPNSECRNSKCQCIIGLSFDPLTYTCVANCTEYGNTFQEDLDHLLVGFSNKVVSTDDPATCMAACVAETTFICRTIELWKTATTPTCYLSTETAYTQPSSRSANVNYDVYQRDCL